jgi:hypothetical protein
VSSIVFLLAKQDTVLFSTLAERVIEMTVKWLRSKAAQTVLMRITEFPSKMRRTQLSRAFSRFSRIFSAVSGGTEATIEM